MCLVLSECTMFSLQQRRVCFNDTVETREIPSAQKHKAKARLVGRGSPKPVNRCLAMPQNASNQSSPLIHWPDSETKNKDNKVREKSQVNDVTSIHFGLHH